MNSTTRFALVLCVGGVASLACAEEAFKLKAVTTEESAAAAAESAPPAAASDYVKAVSPRANFALSNKRWHDDPEVFWKGFLTGLRGFEHFYEPLGNPLYFESPFNNSGLRFLFLHHEFANKSQLGGGDLNVVAVQARLALTERLSLIATKDGFSWLDANALPREEGWNSAAAGAKYAFYVDRDLDLVATGGFRWMTMSGEKKVLQGGVHELSPFISAAKGWDKFHLIGNFTWRAPLDGDDGNNIIQWDLHADYEFFPETLKGFAPFVELHGLHYLDDGTRTPLTVGGADYNNLGSSGVSGSTVIWLGVGARWKLTPHTSIGADYEYPLTNRNADIFGSRVTVDFMLTW